MAGSQLMTLGIRALAANYAALQTTGHNIANANVAGYSRQSVQLATAMPQYTGAGYFGRGVDVTSVTRAHDEFLTREASAARAMSAMDAARSAQLGRLEDIFKSGELGLGNAISSFLNAFGDLASQPGDSATRQVVLARAGDLANRFVESGVALDTLQAGVTSDLGAEVAAVNGLAQSIATANKNIIAANGLGQPANDLLDERDRFIAELSAHVKVTQVAASNGSVSVFIGGGQRLVLGGEAARLTVERDPADTTRSAIGLVDGQGTRLLDGAGFGGGVIAGLLRFQNEDLVDGRNFIGRLAATVSGAINEQQQRGVNLQPPLGSTTSQPLFSVGAPRAVPNARNALDPGGAPIGSVNLSITDPKALQASDYDLRDDATSATGYRLTRLSDGARFEVADGSVVDGVTINWGSPGPQPGDSFLLQPVGRAANAMSRLLDDPRDLAAASPLVGVAPTSNLGTAAVASLTVTASPLPFPGATETFTFNVVAPPVGGFDYTVTSSLTASAVPWKAGQASVGANGFWLQLSGAPKDGDVVDVLPTPASALASNNGNAVALLALRDAALVDGRSLDDGYAQALADVGVRVQGAKSSAAISASVADQAELTRSAQSGVSLDEEAARLLQFQQSYQAAAKMLQVAQALFDTVLETTRG